MDLSAVKDLYVGSTPVQQVWLNGSKVWGRKPAVDEQAIRDAMVLWYDLKKQGATNESMAENPVLVDHSGNGHDATCYNFAWVDMSGIGGYTIRPFTNKESNLLSSERFTGDSYNLIGKPWSNEEGLYWNCGITSNPTGPYKLHLNVSGIVEGNNVYIHQYNNAYYGSVALVNGENRIQIDITQGDKPNYPYLSFHADLPYKTDIHIEILPEYPNALVSDGVDDYALVEGLPLLTKEKGFTVIANRTWIGDANSKSQGFVSKGSTSLWTDGAFYFEGVEGSGNYLFNRVFDNSNGQRGNNPISKFVDDNFTYMTSKQYNSTLFEMIGDGIDTDKMIVFALATNKSYFSQIALRTLLLFNRDLTTDEIEWVKTNLMS